MGDKVAIYFEGEPGDTRVLTYRDLHREVCRFTNGLKKLGVKKGDVVSIYMPMVPELSIAMLACARLGAVHSVIFGGFSAEAIADRNQDAKARFQITADGGYRRGKVLNLKETVDQALQKSPTVEKCVVLRRTGNATPMTDGRDVWWHDLTADVSDDCRRLRWKVKTPLHSLHQRLDRKAKGIRHTTAGYNLYAKRTFQWVFDHRPDDIFWCTADCGWITGHSYIVYGPMSAGATQVMYEGAPNWPRRIAFGRSSKNTKSRFFTPRRRRFEHSLNGAIIMSRSMICRVCDCSEVSAKGLTGSLDVVLRKDRRRALPNCRYLVADRDRRHHDVAAPGGDCL